jgi:phosphoglycolate phosphatase
MIKNIIYDLDGTLINSSKDIINSFNYAFKINNLKTKVNKQYFLNNANLGSKYFIQNAIKKKKINIQKVQLDFQKHYDFNFYKHTTLKDGVKEFLKFTKKKNYTNILCTNKKEKIATKILKKYKIYNYFNFIIGYDTFKETKPEFKFVKKIFKIFQLDRLHTIMIGDTEVDSIMAKRAKIKFFLIKNGYTKNKFFSYDFKFKNFNEIRNSMNEKK